MGSPDGLDHQTATDGDPYGFFTSTRERRLWGWLIVVVATVYSTLGLARSLAETLRSREMLDAAFIAGFLLIIAAVVAFGWKRRPGGAEIGVALGVLAVAAMFVARLGIPEERTHLFEYALVATLIHQALLERRRNGRTVWAPSVLAVVTTGTLGWVDEGIQAILPSRVYDIRDVGFNVLAGFLAVVAGETLRWAARARRAP